MTANGIFQILLLFGLVLACVKPLGSYMARVFQGEPTFLDPVLVPVERAIYQICGVKPEREQHWTTYTIAMLLCNVADCCCSTPCSDCRASCRSIRRG